MASVAGVVLAIFFGIAFTFWMGVSADCVACGALFVARRCLAGAPVDDPIVDLADDDHERIREPVTVDGA